MYLCFTLWVRFGENNFTIKNFRNNKGYGLNGDRIKMKNNEEPRFIIRKLLFALSVNRNLNK